MQITNFSSPQIASFGNKKSIEQNREQTETSTPKSAISVPRNALLAGAVGIMGMLASCNHDRYFIDIADDGYPIIYNQDGDCIDFVPRHLEKDVKFLEDTREQSEENFRNVGKDIIDVDVEDCK